MDTAAAQGSIALLDGERLLARESFQGAAGHAVLLPQVCEDLLHTVGWQAAEVELLAVCSGPGAFAGLRIAFGFAQGFSLAHAIPIIGLNTLDLLAAQCADEADWLAVVVDARRQELFAALYQRQGGQLHRRHAPGSALSPQVWCEQLARWPWPANNRLTWTGNGLQSYPTMIQQPWPLPCQQSDPSLWSIDPASLGRLAQQRWHATPSPKPLLTTLLDYQRRPDADPPAPLLPNR